MALSKHDRKVAAIMGGLRANNWKVDAHLPGQRKPKSIDGMIPDIRARKNGHERVIEVETKQSFSSQHAKQQRATFRKWAQKSSKRQTKVTRTK